MKGIQDENYILDLHMNVVVGGGGVCWLALHACHHSSRTSYFYPVPICLFPLQFQG